MPHSAIDLVRRRSIDLLRANQHPQGSFPASPTYSVYQYCWFRDGSFIADALSRIGDKKHATRFHEWCSQVVDDQASRVRSLVRRAASGESIPGDEMLPTRYALDGGEGTEKWWDYQLDGYGTWLWALAAHVRRHELDAEQFAPSVETIVAYLDAFGDHPCYDWWEEHQHERHLSTFAAIIAGLDAVAPLVSPQTRELAERAVARLRDLVHRSSADAGHLTKWIGSDAVDGSLLSAAVPFGVVQPGSSLAESTYREVVTQLTYGGVYRYLGDTFYGGGQWIILTAWLGWYELLTGRRELSMQRRDWIVAQAHPNGDLPEQVVAISQSPDRFLEWEERWGPIATPLLWSHAMFLTLDHAIESSEVSA